MAQIDSSIYNAFAPKVKSVADYDAERAQGQMNQLNLLRGQQQADEYNRKVGQENALRTFQKNLLGKSRAEQAAAYRDAGYLDQANSLDDAEAKAKEGAAKVAESEAKTKGMTLEQGIKAFEFHTQKLGSITSPQQAAQWADEGLKAGIFTPEKYQESLAVLQKASASPQAFAEWKDAAMKGGQSVTDQLKQKLEAQKATQSAANDIMVPDGQGGFKPNTPLIGAKAGIASAGKTTVSVNTGQKGYENESKLRNDFKSEPIYKAYQDMKDAHAQIKAGIAQENPVGDLATATKIMKLLDPGSVVRESELAMAMAASGRMDRLQNFVQMQMSGQKLTPTQRKEFGVLADDLMAAASQSYNAKHGEYEGFGKSYGLNPQVLGPKAVDPKAPKRRASDNAPAFAPAPEDAAILEKYLPKGGK